MIVREAVAGDAAAIAVLIAELDFHVTAAAVAERIGRLRAAGLPPLVAEDESLVGCLSWDMMEVLHRPYPVGRISLLVVTESVRGRGVGRVLVEAAESRMAERGCGLVEVTSNASRGPAHLFYEHLGYARTSYRFARTL